MKKHYRKENDCLNCGTTLEGKFCHNCGQENLEMKESFGHMMNHAISDYFHFDDQFFHTLKPLFFKPGFLTNEYLIGRRIRYLHPVKMYIFISLIYFILLFQSNFSPVNLTNGDKNTAAKTALKSTDKKLDNLAKDPDVPSYAKSFILDAKRKDDSIAAKKSGKAADTAFSNNLINIEADSTNKSKTYEQYLAAQSKLPADKRDGFFSRYLEKKSYGWQARGTNAKEAFLEDFKHNMPKMMFLLLPLFALILGVAFYKNKKFYVEHLIYAFHFHCFVFLFLTVIMLIEILILNSFSILHSVLQIIAFLVIIWYSYVSLRVVYKRSPWRTISKLIGIALMYFFVFTLCLSLVVVVTALFAVN